MYNIHFNFIITIINQSKYLAKAKKQKVLKQKELILIKETQGCTFHPLTHYSSYYKNKKDLNIVYELYLK